MTLSGQGLGPLRQKLHAKALDYYDSVDEEVSVNPCLYGMKDER